MKTTPIIDRLKAEVSAFAGRVAGSATLEGAATADLAVPHAFVLALGDEAGADDILGTPTVQAVSERFRVIVAVSNASDERGQTANDQVDDLRAAILRALVGYEAGGLYTALEYLGSTLVDIDRARMWWQFDFLTQTSSDLV